MYSRYGFYRERKELARHPLAWAGHRRDSRAGLGCRIALASIARATSPKMRSAPTTHGHLSLFRGSGADTFGGQALQAYTGQGMADYEFPRYADTAANLRWQDEPLPDVGRMDRVSASRRLACYAC